MTKIFVVAGIVSLVMVVLFSVQFVFPISAAQMESIGDSRLELSPGQESATSRQPWQSTVSYLSLLGFVFLAPVSIFGLMLARRSGGAGSVLSPLWRRMSGIVVWANSFTAALLLLYLSGYVVAFIRTLT